MTERMELTEDKIIMEKKWFVWNAFGKESFDSENKLTDEEWKEFITQCNEDDKEMALQNARDLYTRRNEGSCIWVVKSEHIVSSESEDGEAFFDPSNDKMYRHPTFYTMPDGSKHI